MAISDNTYSGEESKVNRKHKDGVFRQLFNDKEKAIELYNALAGTNYDMSADFEFTTLEPAVYMGIKNDVSFMLDNKLIVFLEHQSTWSPNMPLRSLVYAGETFNILYNDSSIYLRTPKKILTPEFYVLYNGRDMKKMPEYLKLSDLFVGKAPENSVELVVKVVNICYNEEEEIFRKSRTLYEYSRFVATAYKHSARTSSPEEAMRLAVEECLREGILVEYLQKQGVDDLSLLSREITMEEYGEMCKQEGLLEGKRDGQLEIARAMKKKALDAKLIMETTGLSEEEIEQL